VLTGPVVAQATAAGGFLKKARALSDRTESIWDSQLAVVVIQSGRWIEEASDE
jgi:hypothetical protein